MAMAMAMAVAHSGFGTVGMAIIPRLIASPSLPFARAHPGGGGDVHGDDDDEDEKHPQFKPRSHTSSIQRKALEQLTVAIAQLHLESGNGQHDYASLLHLCGQAKSLHSGRKIHALILCNGRENDVAVARSLLQMYGMLGRVEISQSLFDRMRQQRDSIVWNHLILAYLRNSKHHEALRLFPLMQRDGAEPDKFTFTASLSASSALLDLAQGKRIHAHVADCGTWPDLAVTNALLHMYGKCGELGHARALFNSLAPAARNLISWTAMIKAYAQNNRGEDALVLFQEMESRGLTPPPDHVAFLGALEACASLKSVESGREIHARIAAAGLSSLVVVRNGLVSMYARCGRVDEARKVFDRMARRNVITWNAMIAAYAQNGYGECALVLFEKMGSHGVKPDNITYLSILDVCSDLELLELGREVHRRVDADGFGADVASSNALMNMYGKCGSVKEAKAVFDRMDGRDLISWTTIIAVHAQHGQGREALALFQRMESEGVVTPNRVTFLSVLDACAKVESLEITRFVHERLLMRGFGSDTAVMNSLVSLYGKCGGVGDARAVFDGMAPRDVISWNAMISAYVQNGHGAHAWELFLCMDAEEVTADRVTMLAALDACSSLGSLRNGRIAHERITASPGGYSDDIPVCNALITMYGKCGSLADAHLAFDEACGRSIVSWNAIIAAYAENGRARQALELLSGMDLEPNSITFLSILNACSHAGLLIQGWQLFVSMSQDYGIMPLEAHYRCLIDLLGRSGRLDEAEQILCNMPGQPDSIAWSTFLGACPYPR